MTSAIETTIERHRAALLVRDDEARRRMTTAYQRIRQTLIARLDELVAVVAANGGLSGPELFKLDRVVSLLDDIETAINALSDPSARFIASAQRQAAQLALDSAFDLVVAQRAILRTVWNRVNVEAVSSMVGRLGDGSPLRAYLDGLGPKTSQTIQDALIDGVGRGLNPHALANTLAETVDMAANKLAMTTRTAILSSYRSASLASYAANKDVLSGWVWVASLSDRTCSSCLANHLREFPLSQTFFEAHVNCRCSPAPAIKGVDFPINETGADWFDRQSKTVQDRILGRSGGELYRDGAVELGDFQTLRRDAVWGDAYTAVGAKTALANAASRDRSAA